MARTHKTSLIQQQLSRKLDAAGWSYSHTYNDPILGNIRVHANPQSLNNEQIHVDCDGGWSLTIAPEESVEDFLAERMRLENADNQLHYSTDPTR